MAKRIPKAERMFVYAVIIIVDISQILLDFVAIGIVVNRILDIIVGIILLVYGFSRNLLTPRVSLGIVASFVIEEIPVVDVLPMWTLDVKFMFASHDASNNEEVAYGEVEKMQRGITERGRRAGIEIDETRRTNLPQQRPLYKDGKRFPRPRPKI